MIIILKTLFILLECIISSDSILSSLLYKSSLCRKYILNHVENKWENLLAGKMQKVGVEGYRITAPFVIKISCNNNILVKNEKITSLYYKTFHNKLQKTIQSSLVESKILLKDRY